MQNLIRIQVCSAATILLFVATALCLGNWNPPVDLVILSDPIFHVPLPRLFWIAAVIATLVALVCLFTHKAKAQVTLVALYTLSFMTYRFWVVASGITPGLGGYLGRLGSTFGITGTTADGVLMGLGWYLLTGSAASLLLLRRTSPVPPTVCEGKKTLGA